MDAVNASTESAVLAANRPPQSFFLVVFTLIDPRRGPKQTSVVANEKRLLRLFFAPLLPSASLGLAQALQPEPQGIEANESFRVGLLIDLIRLEGRYVGIVE